MMSGALPDGRASDKERIAEPIVTKSLLPGSVAQSHLFAKSTWAS